MNKAPTPDQIVQLRYDYLKQTYPEHINNFEEALAHRITTGGKSFKVPCTSDEEYDFYKHLSELLGYPEFRSNAWDHKRGLLTIAWKPADRSWTNTCSCRG